MTIIYCNFMVNIKCSSNGSNQMNGIHIDPFCLQFQPICNLGSCIDLRENHLINDTVIKKKVNKRRN